MATSKEKVQKAWSDAASEAENAIQKLLDMQAECQEAYDNMSEKAQEGDKGVALSDITDLDLEGAMGTIQEAAALEIP